MKIKTTLRAAPVALDSFSTGTASELAQWLLSQRAWNENEAGDMWEGRCISLLSTMLCALVYLRDHKNQPLTVRGIRDSLSLESVATLAVHPDLPARIRGMLRNCLNALPGYEARRKPDEQDDITRDFHGYTQMQICWIFIDKSDADLMAAWRSNAKIRSAPPLA